MVQWDRSRTEADVLDLLLRFGQGRLIVILGQFALQLLQTGDLAVELGEAVVTLPAYSVQLLLLLAREDSKLVFPRFCQGILFEVPLSWQIAFAALLSGRFV